MAIDELYEAGDFSETASEKNMTEAVNKDRRSRFFKTIQNYRVQTDLTTVKESIIEDVSTTQVLSDSMNQPQSYKRNQSYLSLAKHSRFDDSNASKNIKTDEYYSFHAK
jgi:hypothetical protein